MRILQPVRGARPASSTAALLPLALVLALLPACSAETRGPAPPRPLDYAVGIVSDGRSELPIPGVEVYTGSDLVAMTDSGGRYEAAAGFHPVADWRIHFRKEGYKPRSFDMPEAGTRDPNDPTRLRLDVVMQRLP